MRDCVTECAVDCALRNAGSLRGATRGGADGSASDRRGRASAEGRMSAEESRPDPNLAAHCAIQFAGGPQAIQNRLRPTLIGQRAVDFCWAGAVGGEEGLASSSETEGDEEDEGEADAAVAAASAPTLPPPPLDPRDAARLFEFLGSGFEDDSAAEQLDFAKGRTHLREHPGTALTATGPSSRPSFFCIGNLRPEWKTMHTPPSVGPPR